MSLPSRVSVIGSQISLCDAAAAIRAIEEHLADGAGGYVCFTNAHTAVTGRRDPVFRDITNRSLLSVADGKSVFWVGRAKVGSRVGHIPGPDFFLAALRYFAADGHFLYGSTPRGLQLLVESLQKSIPDLRICGTLSPPFRGLSAAEREQHYQVIRASGACFVWVGLGAPKQEQWMAEACTALAPCILLGVGAAFDFHAGTLRRAPAPMRAYGLEWLHRLMQEPRRLWRRYITTNSMFVWYAAADLLRNRSRREL